MRILSGFIIFWLYWSCFLHTTAQAQSTISESSQTGKNHATVVYQKKQQSALKSISKPKVSRSPQQFIQELSIPGAAVKIKEDAPEPLAAVLAYAWQEYRLENYTQAKVFFLQAVESDNFEVRRDAENGLVYCYLKLGEVSAALPLLQKLVARGEQLESTAPALAAILYERGDFEALHELLPKLTPAQGEEWQKKIVLARFQQDSLSLSTDADQVEIEQFLQKYKSFLAECLEHEQFLRMALLLVDYNSSLSKELFADLSQCYPEDQNWQERVMREQLHLLSRGDLLITVAAPSDGRVPDQARNALLQEALWLKIDDLEQGSSEYHSFVQLLYEQDPENTEAALMAAWSCYQQEDYTCSQDLFSDLIRKNSSDDALLGLAYTLQKTGASAEALELLDEYPDKNNTKLSQLRYELQMTLGRNLYNKKNYKEAMVHLQQARDYQPENMELVEMILWSRYHLGETKPLTDFLWQQYQENRSAETAKLLSDLLYTRNDPVFTRTVMDGFAESDKEAIQKLAGDYAFRQKHPVLANQIYQGQSPYAGTAVPALDTMFLFRSRGGDDGTSSLDVSTFILKQQFSSHPGKTWSAAFFPLYMDSGRVSDDLPVGTAFHHLQGIEGNAEAWQDHLLAWGWRGELKIEGDIDWGIGIGTTPLNGIVAPTPVGKIQSRGSDWSVAVARDPVRDSMLSWIGQTDPYTGTEWGRITQTKLSAAKTISFSDWWLAFEGEYGFYHGKRVEDNTSLTASVSGGFTDNWQNFERSTGLFIFGRGFNRNSNFYTFGHGGYYSPARQIIGGPFFRLVTSTAHEYWLDVSCSAGINYSKTDDAPHYAELGSFFNIDPYDAAWQDLSGTYKGESETGLGVDAQIRGLLPLSNRWFIGGEASVNNVADYTEWQVAVSIRYRFGEGMGLGLPERDFSMITGLVQ